MNPGYSEIEPMVVLPEFVCDAIPGEMLERTAEKMDPKPKKGGGMAPKTSSKATNGKTKGKDHKRAKPKRGKRKGPSA
jgi:hypothetical protein